MFKVVAYHRTLHKYINWKKMQAHRLIVKGLTTRRQMIKYCMCPYKDTQKGLPEQELQLNTAHKCT